MFSKYKSFKVQSNFRNLMNGISTTQNLLNTPGSWNSVPRTSNTKTFETSGAQPSEPGNPEGGNWTGTWNRKTFRNPAKPAVPGTHSPEPQNLSPAAGSGASSRNPFLSINRLQVIQNTPESILRKGPRAFCCWGKNKRQETDKRSDPSAAFEGPKESPRSTDRKNV